MSDHPLKPETIARVQAIWNRVSDAHTAEVAEMERRRLEDVAKMLSVPLNHSDDVDTPKPVNPAKTITIDGMIKALNRIKEKQFKGNGKIPLQVHVEEQDVIYNITCVGATPECDEALIFCDTVEIP